MGFSYTLVYTKSGNLWACKMLNNKGYVSWKLLDNDDFLSGVDVDIRYHSCSNEEQSLGYPCSHAEMRKAIY